ncbi:MAG: response regulator, partial [Deltaproteobacteria bacterium]
MPRRILVVDDEPDLVATLAYNLERQGYDVATASTGSAALAAARRDPAPDLVLLDLMLPDLPGTDVCRALRADPRTAHIPIVMLTAKGDEIDRVVGFELGADDYVVKPFSVRELMLRVRAVLHRARRGAADGGSASTFGCLRIDRE